jgi:large subunit ribosomal protein L24
MKIRRGDTVIVISGKDKGKKGKVLEVFPKIAKIVVEGVNLKKKHMRPRKAGEKGQIIQTPSPLHVSNVKIFCPRCNRGTRIGYRLEGKKKFRICKKCQTDI